MYYKVLIFHFSNVKTITKVTIMTNKNYAWFQIDINLIY